MLKKALVITSFAVGYVLGAKAGTERYEQIRTLFLRVKTDPNLRVKVHEAMEFAHEHGAALAGKAADAVGSESGHDNDLPTGRSAPDPESTFSIKL